VSLLGAQISFKVNLHSSPFLELKYILKNSIDLQTSCFGVELEIPPQKILLICSKFVYGESTGSLPTVGHHFSWRSTRSATPLGLRDYTCMVNTHTHGYVCSGRCLALASTAFNKECLRFLSCGRRARLAFELFSLSPQRSVIGDTRYHIPDTRYTERSPESPESAESLRGAPRSQRSHIQRSPYGRLAPWLNTHN